MKIASCFLVVCAGLVILVSGFLSAQDTPAGLSGTWAGQATKQAAAKPYKVTVILNGNKGFIEYSEMKCGGTLQFVRKTGDTFSYRETITHGKTSCPQDGRVDVVPNGNLLAWNWVAGETRATATLTKTPASAPAGCLECDISYDRDFQACFRTSNALEQQKCEDRAQEDARSCKVTCRN